MKSKPDIHEFLGGAPSDNPGAKPGAAPAAPPPRITKTIRLATDLEKAIKKAAHSRWEETGRKVSESDIVDEALRKYLNV